MYKSKHFRKEKGRKTKSELELEIFYLCSVCWKSICKKIPFLYLICSSHPRHSSCTITVSFIFFCAEIYSLDIRCLWNTLSCFRWPPPNLLNIRGITLKAQKYFSLRLLSLWKSFVQVFCASLLKLSSIQHKVIKCIQKHTGKSSC